MVATLQAFGVHQSFLRTRVSNDNPFVESIFGTAKTRPNYPDKPFDSIEAARQWVDAFVAWYNDEHRHSGISYVTPTQRHAGTHEELLAHRERVYAVARARRPERWTGTTRNWDPKHVVRLNPKPHALTDDINSRPKPITRNARPDTILCGNYPETHRNDTLPQ